MRSTFFKLFIFGSMYVKNFVMSNNAPEKETEIHSTLRYLR